MFKKNRHFLPLCKQLGLTICFVLLSVSITSVAFSQSAFDDPAERNKKVNTNGDLRPTEKKINAGSVSLGSEAQVVVLFKNESAEPITSGDLNLYPSSNVSATINSNECIENPLAPDAVCAIALSVQGLQPGNFRIELLMRHNGRSNLVTSAISGSVEAVNEEKADISTRDLEVLPKQIDFGTLKSSRSMTDSIVLRNVTARKLKISSIEIASGALSGYSHTTECDTIVSGAACAIVVNWSPKQTGPSTGVLAIKHNGPTGLFTIPLKGNYKPAVATEVTIFPEAIPGKGLLTSSQTAINFGNGIKSESSITVSLVNAGDSPLKFKKIGLSNDDNGISITNSGCRPGTVLEPIEACPLTLVWKPVRAGSIIDDLQIIHDGARGVLVLPVRGKADTVAEENENASVMIDDDFFDSLPVLSDQDIEDEAPEEEEEEKEEEKSTGFDIDILTKPGTTVVTTFQGYRVTSLGPNKAIISGPQGTRVVFEGGDILIGGISWVTSVVSNAVEFNSDQGQKVVLLFDRSLSFGNNIGFEDSDSEDDDE